MKSYKQIAKENNLSLNYVRRVSSLLDIKGQFYNSEIYLNGDQIKEILDYRSTNSNNKDNHRRKITIIEFYQNGRSCRQVAFTLNIYRRFVNAAVKEWKENDGYIVVESSMNNEPAAQKRNIHKIKSGWKYILTHNKVRYRETFKTEEEAFEALQKLKLSLKD